MKNQFLFIFISLFFGMSSCYADSIQEINMVKDSFTFNVKIKAIDLSEDAIAGATYNDEVFFFVYKQNGSDMPQLLTAQFFRLDTTNRIKTIKIKTDSILPKDTLTFILLEQDTKKQIKGIEPTCRLYLNEIYAAYLKTGNYKLYDFFDDDDMLGMYRITGDKFNLSKPIIKKLETMNFFDWAVYKVEISK
jgi:hypothetical protein